MVLKRLIGQEGEEEDGSFVSQSKRPRPLLNAMREVVVAQSMQRHLSKLEPFIRRVVQEEVQSALNRYLHSAPRLPVDRIQPAVTRPYRLHFQNRLPGTLFTGSRIESEGKMPVQILVIDSNSNEIITSGPLSTIKIEILVLDGDFGDGQEEWTEEDFSDSIVREREGKRPLLTGELGITLSSGVGYLADATFTDNSSWIRSRKFRLGARAVQSRCTEARVHESITEAFLVKDHRGELYKKHHPPVLMDEVWRLEKIGKDGAFHKRLTESGINTVQDFLRFSVLDQDKLRNLLGSGMSNKTWEATLEHARECVLDERMYSYCSSQGVVLLFDSIFQLIGARFNHVYHPLDGLTVTQKVLVESMKALAYKNPKGIVEFHEALFGRTQRPLHMLDAVPFPGASSIDPCNWIIPATHRDEAVIELGFQNQSHQPSSELLGDQPRDIFTMQGFHPVQRFGSLLMDSSFNARNFLHPQLELGNFHAGENFMGSNSEADFFPRPIWWDHGNELHQVPNGEASRGCVPNLLGMESHGSMFHGNGLNNGGEMFLPRMRVRSLSGMWVKLMAAIKWVGILKRLASRRARIVDLGYSIDGSSMFADAYGVDW